MKGLISLVVTGSPTSIGIINKNISTTSNAIINMYQKKITNSIIEDRWVYSMKFEKDNLGNKIDEILINILPYKEYFTDIFESCKIEFNCYIVTELDIIDFIISIDQFDKINQLNMKINFNILSYLKEEDI